LLLDRRLPDGDGVELCREIRSKNPHGYILILTGDATKESKLQGFDCGADDYVTKPFNIEELMARIRAGVRIVELQKALLASNQRLEELARTDPLTGLPNRRAFDRELPLRFQHSRRYGRPLSVVMIDIDHFKAINDQYGHPAGDAVLKKLARILHACTRDSDFVARIGGEEFVVLLPETPLLESLQFAEKIRAAVAAADFSSIGPDRVTVSIGVGNVPHSHLDSAEALLAAADVALYRAKENGRNRVEFERRSAKRERYSPSFGSTTAAAVSSAEAAE
jgi:diguanylate cyclase (GGDEF)-like protein